MRRRAFLRLVGTAPIAVWARGAHAQQALPIVALLASGSEASTPDAIPSIVQAIESAGLTDGRNITIEAHWALGHYDRLAPIAGVRSSETFVMPYIIKPTTAWVLPEPDPAELPRAAAGDGDGAARAAAGPDEAAPRRRGRPRKPRAA